MEDSSNCDGESVAMIPKQKTLNIDCSSSSDVDASSMVSMKEGCESPLSSWDSEPENDISPAESVQAMEEQNHFIGVENMEDGFSWEVDNRSYDELLKKFNEKEEELRVSNVKLQLSEQEIIKLAVQVENSKIQINDVCEKLEVKEIQILNSENQLDNLRGELNWKNDELDNVQKELELKEEELNEAKKVSEEEIFKLKNQIKESENQLDDVRGEFNLKKEEFEKETDKLRIRVSESSTKIRNLKEQLKISTDQVSFFRKELDIKSSMANQLQYQIKGEMQNRALLESMFIMNKDDNTNQKEELKKLKLTMFDKHLEFHCEKTKMEADIVSLSNQKKQLTSKLENYESRNKELEQKLMRNEAENSKHLQCEIIRYLTKKLGERVNDVEAAKKKSEKVMIEIGEANVKIDELKAEICSRDDEISSTKKYLNEINTSREKLVVDYRGKVNEEKKLIMRVEELEKEVSKQNGVILDMAEEKKEAIKELCNSVEHYKSRYNDVIQAFNDLDASRSSHCYGFLNIWACLVVLFCFVL